MNLLLWSPSMSLSMMLGIISLIALFVLFTFRYIRKSDIGYFFVVIIFLVLGVFSFWTIRSYTFPSGGKQVFSNVDYHVLEHLGFDFQGNLLLVDDTKPDETLWDNKEGKVEFLKEESVIKMDAFFEPFYKNKKLVNNIFNKNINDGLEIWKGEKLILQLNIEDITSEKSRYLLQSQNDNSSDTCKFKVRLQQGYPLLDLIHSSKKRIMSPEDEKLIEGCYILRPDKFNDEDGKSTLYFFPSKLIYLGLSDSITIKNYQGENFDINEARTSFEVAVANQDDFDIGIGKKRNPKFSINKISKNNSEYRYGFSKKYRLRGDLGKDSLYSLFITSSEKGVTQNNLKSGFFYPLLEEEENKNHINGTLHYYQQSSRNDLILKFIDNNKPFKDQIKYPSANQKISMDTKGNKNLKWVFQFNDLRASNALKVSYLYYFVLFYLSMVLVICSVLGIDKMTTIELLSYIVIFAFLLVRIILQWRMSTFPPLENISAFEYSYLTGFKHFLYTCFSAVLFFGFRFFFSSRFDNLRNEVKWRTEDWLDQLSTKTKFQNSKIKDWVDRGNEVNDVFTFSFLWIVYSIFLFLLLRAVGGILPFSAERFYNIALPVFLYLLFDYKIQSNNEEESIFDPIRLLNSTFAFLWLATFDTGFSVIFILFLLLSNALIYSVRLFEEESNKIRSILVAVFGFISIYLILSYSAPIFSNGFNFFINNPEMGLLVIGSLFTIGVFVVLWKLKDTEDFIYDKKIYVIVPVFLIAVFGILSVLKPTLLSDTVKKFSYVKYRAEIQKKNISLDHIIEKVKFDSGEADLALRAGQNQWFINNYIDIDKTRGNNSYFNLQDHFNRGSSYITQTTDLVVSRYLISEHSQMVVILLLGLLLILLTGYTLEYNIYNESLSTIFKISVLLFTISYFIWLTATNRFIFFGQDFPLISLTSVFTVLFTLGLFLALIVLTDKKGEGNELAGSVFRKHIYPFIPIAIIGIIGFSMHIQNSILDDSKFNINQTMTKVKSVFNQLNQVYLDVQEKNKIEINQEGFNENQKIEQSIKLLSEQEEVKDLLEGDTASLFIKSIYKHFVETPNKRNPEEPVYIITNAEGRFQFGTNRTYYLVQPPDYRQKKWKGDLLAAKLENGAVFLNLENATNQSPVRNKLEKEYNITEGYSGRYSNVDLFVIPSQWYYGSKGLPKVLLSIEGGADEGSNISIRNNLRNSSSFKQLDRSPAIALFNNDLVSFLPKNKKDGGSHFLYTNNANNFLMKNIWLNGKSKKFYPLGEDFLWAYHYSSTAEKVYKDDPVVKNINTSIDLELTKETRKILKKKIGKNNNKEFGVVVLDDKGRIRLMADYKPNLELNPNDFEEIHEFRKEMQINVARRTEREVLGNLNLLRMKIGPGSSLKPLMYAAVTSQYPLDWENLIQVETSILGKYTNPQNKNHLVYYAGQPIKGTNAQEYYKRNKSKKNLGFEWGLEYSQYLKWNNKGYLIHSKNAYHSIINYLGSYNKAEIQRLDQLLKSGNDDNHILKSQINSIDFPRISFGTNKTYSFNPGFFPPTSGEEGKSYFGNNNSLLSLGFLENFDLSTYKRIGITSGLFKNIDPNASKIFGHPKAKYSYYSYPESSEYFQINRKSTHEGGHIRGIVQSTLGGYPIKVTPLKMAEMYGRLFAFDRSFKATLDPYPKRQQDNIIQDDAWGDNNYFSFVQGNIYSSLEKVIKEGTGRNLNRYIKNQQKGYNRKRYNFYYYAKTGTISSVDEKSRQQDKLLMVTISNKNLSKIEASDLEDVKFYTIYFSAYKFNAPDWELIKELLAAIEESKSFKKHFNL